MRAWSWLRSHAVLIIGCLVAAYMLIPIVVIAVFSFNDPEGKFNFTWEGFTLDNWGNAFGLPDLTESLVTSLQLAAISTVIATALGTLIALALVRHQFFGRRAANLLIVIPMATPEVVIGAALLSLFVYFQFGRGFTTLLIAHVMFTISFVVIVVRSRLIGFDRSLEEAARDLGATALTTFRTITLPLLAPGIVAGGLLAFALSIDDFVISNFNAGGTVTFPLFIYGASQRGIPPEVNVLATMLFLVTVAAMAITVIQQRRAEKLAQVRPDEEENGTTPLASGRDPVAGTGSAS